MRHAFGWGACWAVTLAGLALLTPSRASAIAVPDLSNSSVPSRITLVGLNGGVPASDVGEFVISIRDLANNVMPGVFVALDFSNSPDVRLGTSQPDAETLLDCATARVGKVTDVHGQVRFTLVGRGTGVFLPGSTGCFAVVTAFGTFVGNTQVTVYDLDGQSGVSGGDLATLIAEFVGNNHSRALDYDESGFIGGGDLAMWLAAFSAGTQSASCGAVCP